MPFTYARDDTHRRIRVVLTESATLTEALAILDRQADEGTWRYGLLYDARSAVELLGQADAQELVEHAQELAQRHGPRGLVATVTRDAGMIGTVQTYAFQAAKANLKVQPFWDLSDAERWLDERTKPNGGE
jgi:hypothetical protein